jgi:hypothetical protein
MLRQSWPVDAVGAPVAVHLANHRTPCRLCFALLRRRPEGGHQVGRRGSSSIARASARPRQASSRVTARRTATRSAWVSSQATSIPVTVRTPGWAKNPPTSAWKVRVVGAVKQEPNAASRSASERGRLGVGIGGYFSAG